MKPLAVLALAMLLASPALAQEGPARLRGSYILSGVSEGTDVCKVRLTSQPAIGGWSLDVGKDCYAKFGLSRDIAAWNLYPDGAVGFIDPLRKPLLKFVPSEIGGYVAERPGEEALSLARDAGASKPLSAQQRMSGGWSLTGLGGQPACGFTSKATASGKAGTLKMKPGCAAKWKDGGWASWRLQGEQLTLYDGKGKALQTLKQGDIVTFEADDAAGEPIYFSRD